MRELDNCLELARLIKIKEEQIQEIRLRTATPKNQVLTDMPKGGGKQSNAMDDYLMKIERIERSKSKLQRKLINEWENVRFIFRMSDIKRTDTIELMYLRFCCGLSWNKCANKMKEAYPDSKWDINRCFREYRNVLHKIRNGRL